MVEQELVGGRIEKSFSRDHRLSLLGKPRDAKRRSSGRIFLSYPHTHNRFLYSIIVEMVNSGLQIRVRIGTLVSLFLIQNICCGYSKEPSQ